jgi:hypothetical protein
VSAQEATSRALALAATPYQQSGARVDVTAPSASFLETQRVVDALRNVMGAIRDTAPSGRIAVSKVERIIRNEVIAQRERG